MFRNAPVIAAVLVAAAAVGSLTMGCELAASVDRDNIPGGGGATSSTAASTASSAVSSSATTGAGGMSGCAAASECPDTVGDCKTPTCTASACGEVVAAKGAA